ncbi:MAG: hypothetical protein CL681_29145 [Blastopirellula sp.]|nr:hypothetical protein [Blastopirellula sp.]
MRLHGKNWDGEWEPAAASWFKTPLGWRLAYGEPKPDIPIGGLTPEWTEIHVTWTNPGPDSFCQDGQTEDGNGQIRCKYSGYKDRAMCQAQFYVFNSLSEQVGSYRTTRTMIDDTNPLIIPVSNVTWETIGNFHFSSGWGPPVQGWTWESRGEDGQWLQRGTLRDAVCFAPSFFQLTEENPALQGGTKTIEYIEYNWDCPMSKEIKDAPYTEDQ